MKLNLQMFAKSSAYQRDRRKSKAYETGKKIQEELKKEEEKKPAQEKKPTKGEAVISVSPREEYDIYLVRSSQEIRMTENGKPMTRTGSQILSKMRYDKQRSGWVSKSGKVYRVRRRK